MLDTAKNLIVKELAVARKWSEEKAEKAQLRERISQLDQEVRGLESQLAAKNQEAVLVAEDLGGQHGQAGSVLLYLHEQGLLRPFYETYKATHEKDKTAKLALETVRQTNAYITDNHGESGMFATFFLGILEPATGRLTYVNGGHEPPFRGEEPVLHAWMCARGRST